jgi:C4-dicarboxylate-binding protein DctP
MKDATAYANQSAQKDNDDAVAAMKAAGKSEFHTLTDAERIAWRKAMLPVHEEMASRVGKDLIQAFYKETGVAGQ